MVRKANKSLKDWVNFVKKVQKEEGLSYRDAMMRAKTRKNKGEKWMTGGTTDAPVPPPPGTPAAPAPPAPPAPPAAPVPPPPGTPKTGGKKQRKTAKQQGGRRRKTCKQQ